MLNNIKVEQIENEFRNKIHPHKIIEVCNEFDSINSVVSFDGNIEEVVKEYLKLEVEKIEINIKYQSFNNKLRELENKSQLLKRVKIDSIRSNGNIETFLNSLDKSQLNTLLRLGLIRGEEMSEIELRRFKENQKNYSNNYNQLERENISTSNTKIWN
tara:strand:- start:54 stop:527 length:474 start_codon:yes stop_codon:yes gene_type:complete